jgi:hypothetical protein
MTETSRFSGLKKLPDVPAAKILARGNVVLQTSLDAPASASIPDVLQDLDDKGALLDMFQVLAHALPPRQATWWACLSARDTLPEGTALPASVRAAEAWVFRPGMETRAQAREALDAAGNEDETVLCAMAAAFADGTLGPGELDDYDAPPGAVGGAVFGMVLTALFHEAGGDDTQDENPMETRGPLYLARALDIARGGNGRIAVAPPQTVPTDSPNQETPP